VPIGHGNSFFGHGKSLLKKSGHPDFDAPLVFGGPTWPHVLHVPKAGPA